MKSSLHEADRHDSGLIHGNYYLACEIPRDGYRDGL